MLSSRCNDQFPAGSGTTLSTIRTELKAEIEGMKLAGKSAFEVWINEDTSPQPGTVDSWDACIEAVKDCDILIVLSNGNAGWSKAGGDIGICHAEMMTGLATAPGKVRLIELGKIAIANDDQGQRNKRFQDELDKQSLFRGGTVATVDQLKNRVREALHDAVIKLAQAGVRDAAKGKHHSGAALDWTRLSFPKRAAEMQRTLDEALRGQPGTSEKNGRLFVKMDGQDVLVELHAVPAAMSISAAREMVGQPFLKDHEREADLKGQRGGPFHLIACHKTVSESQAITFLGFPDAVHVDGPYGRYVACNVQKIQVAFLTNCVDETSTRHTVQRFIEWLKQTNEETLLAQRAAARARIVKAIAKEA